MSTKQKGYKAVEIEYRQAVEKAQRQALAWLESAKGIRKGGYVARIPNKYYPAATYLVDKIYNSDPSIEDLKCYESARNAANDAFEVIDRLIQGGDNGKAN